MNILTIRLATDQAGKLMKKSTNRNIFTTWEDSQKQLWKNLATIANPFEFPKKLGFFQNPSFQILSTWGKAAINQSLEIQSAWLEQWTQRMKIEAKDPDLFNDLMSQAIDSMSQYTTTQNGLWENWFRVLEASAALPGIGEHQRKILDSWKQMVNQSLSEQSDWLSVWSDQIAYKQLQEKELETFTSELKGAMEGWMCNQRNLWQYWFDFLNGKESSSHHNNPPQLKNGRLVYQPLIRDDLKSISGIGPQLEKTLNQQGIVSFQQLIDLSDEEIDHLEDSVIGFRGRIRRDNWIDQAKTQLKEKNQSSGPC